jgi:KDO2-lipid IV(A) lauroyltransferase
MSLYDHAKVVYWLRDPFWGAVDYATYYALRMLPSRAASEVGRCLGVAAGRIRFADLTARSDRNLSLIRPDLTPAARRQLVQQMWANLGRMTAEMPALDRLWDSAQITLVNEQSVLGALRSGRPMVLVFPHLGHWEMLISAVRRLGVVLNVVYEVLRSRFERRLAASARRRIGYRQIPGTRRSVRQMYAALERREAVMMAIDEFKHGNVISPAFGRALPRDSNIRYALKLARRFDAAILPCLCIRTSPLAFRVEFHDELINPGAEDLNALCESWIRSYPEQWYMLHRLRMEMAA